jgi:murein L,D-transpeptidase YafK
MRSVSRWALRLALAGLASAVVVAALFLPSLRNALHDWQLARDKASRLATFAAGRPLPDTPDVDRLTERLTAQGLRIGAPVFMRIFKREFLLELWLEKAGRYELFASYPICRWSGALGPKLAEGDRQSPEGVYSVGKEQLNPNSRWHRSFNLGFPNAFDRSHGRSGSFLMVHGGCGSIGCYAMTDPVITEIWTLVTAALGNGQKRFDVHVFPFRMTPENLELWAGHRWLSFWQQLKPIHDSFEQSRRPPRVTVCEGRYELDAARPDCSPV